jgi:hypothetical protein
MTTTRSQRVASRPRAGIARRSGRGRRGVSVVLVVIVLAVLIGFASLAVDVGRVRVVKVQLQTAADAAATAGASGIEMFPSRGVLEPEERAYEAAAANFSLDQRDSDGRRQDSSIELIVDEDVQLGRWNDVTREFTKLEQENGGPDERRQSNAIKVWTRRVTRYRDDDGNVVNRGTGVPLILAPVLRIFSENAPITGEVQAEATAVLNGHVETAAFVGLQEIRFNGAVRSDSYVASEGYPGPGGPNANTSFATNGEVTFSGAATILGSVYPGKNQWIQPQPLRGSVNITGHMFSLAKTLTAMTPPFAPPASGYNLPDTFSDIRALRSDQGFDPPNGNDQNQVTLQPLPQAPAGTATYFYFSNWNTRSDDQVTIDNSKGPVEIWVSGDFSHSQTAMIRISTRNHPVTFHLNGDADFLGRGIVHQQSALPANVQIRMTRPGTTLRIGGSSRAMHAHVAAAGSNISFTGDGSAAYHFYGRAVGRSLTVASNVQLHYDESLGPINPLFRIGIVQ